MKKYLFTAFLFILGFSIASAQKGNIGVNIGLEGALPLGNLGNSTSFGIGGTAKGLYGLNDDADITLTAGYIAFPAKSGVEATIGMIPFMPGYRHKFDGFYIEPQLGLVNYKFTYNGPGSEWFGTLSSSASFFSYAFGAGMKSNKWDLSARFQGFSGTSFIGVRVGYDVFSSL